MAQRLCSPEFETAGCSSIAMHWTAWPQRRFLARTGHERRSSHRTARRSDSLQTVSFGECRLRADRWRPSSTSLAKFGVRFGCQMTPSYSLRRPTTGSGGRQLPVADGSCSPPSTQKREKQTISPHRFCRTATRCLGLPGTRRRQPELQRLGASLDDDGVVPSTVLDAALPGYPTTLWSRRLHDLQLRHLDARAPRALRPDLTHLAAVRPVVVRAIVSATGRRPAPRVEAAH